MANKKIDPAKIARDVFGLLEQKLMVGRDGITREHWREALLEMKSHCESALECLREEDAADEE